MKGQNFCIYYSFFLFYDEFWFRKVEPIDYKSYFRNQVFFTQSGKKWVWRLEPCPMQGMTVNADNTATYYIDERLNGIVNLCCKTSSILCMDTIFNLTSIWVTNLCAFYSNLINLRLELKTLKYALSI